MTNSFFTFKQFTIRHNRSTMPVGTDGVLLGAWAQTHPDTRTILDVGTGSGLIAIMMAQRTKAHITGIDIHQPSILQARQNSQQTPWAKRIQFHTQDLTTYHPQQTFQLILSNPPFFHNSLPSPDETRLLARQGLNLTPQTLLQHSARLLQTDGSIQIILPYTLINQTIHHAAENNLHLVRQLTVHTTPRKPPKRVLLHFAKQQPTHTPQKNTLYLTDTDGTPTPQYRQLTQPFYLDR